MNCPTCNVWTTVTDTRNKGTHVQRNRECGNGHKFTTKEQVVPSKKHGGSTQDRAIKEDIHDQHVPL
jgi:transcriptional regulator NrdR family protein